MQKNPILITQPDLPSLDKFFPYLEKIWKNKWLTNNGEFHKELEEKMAEFLKVPYVSLFTNGTLALITAIQLLELKGEVITTPYSFVATTHSLWWNNIKPVFVDIEDVYGNIDTSKIEASITPNTSAILAVHVYGNPCNVEAIELIAKKHNLKVIYDAAHAFGVEKDGKSILNYGDVSILSFHATKVFNTFEGGAVILQTKEQKEKIDLLKNFGIQDEETVLSAGINGKMNEFQAAIGLLQLNEHKERIEKRETVFNTYKELFRQVKGIRMIVPQHKVKSNFSYLPILIDEKIFGKSRDFLYNLLKENNIYVRKYFYPLISNIPLYIDLESSNKENLPIGNSFSDSVLCLPIYPNLGKDDIIRVFSLINA
jgi:dTDP-4-amino-4,6-dideoxygalactose transaminase